MTVNVHSGIAKLARLFQERNRIQHHAIANHTPAAASQHAARYKLQHKLCAVDDDGMAGIMSAGIAGYDGEVLRQHVNDFSFALVAPLGANDHRSLAFVQCKLHEGSTEA